MIVPRVVLLGGLAAATPWVGIAKKLARSCYDLNITHKVYKLGSGVEIRVENIFPPRGKLAGICKVWIKCGKLLLLFESGLMVSDQWPSYIGYVPIETDPPLLYLSSASRAYLSSQGTYFPTPAAHYAILQGYISLPNITSAPDPLPGAPVSYTSTLYKQPLEMFPVDHEIVENNSLVWLPTEAGLMNISSMYTGLLRQAVQAKLGATNSFLSLAAMFPWEMRGSDGAFSSFCYYTDGLLRTDDYTYFMVRTTMFEGCLACRMQTSPNLELIREVLVSGTYASEEDRFKLESLLMATLKPAAGSVGGYDITELLEWDEITPQNRNPSIGLPLAYGFHYSYPPLTECAIIRHGSTVSDLNKQKNWSYETKVFFTLSKDTNDVWQIEASTETIDKGYWVLTGDTGSSIVIWGASRNVGISLSALDGVWDHDAWKTTPVAVPLYCWYDKTGYKPIYLYLQSTTDNIHNPPLPRNQCYAESFFSKVLPVGGIRHIQDITFGESTNLSEEVLGEYTEWTGDITITPGGETLFDGAPRNFTDCQGVLHWFSGIRRIYYVEAEVDTFIERRIKNQQPELPDYVLALVKVLVLPSYNAEAAAILSRRARSAETVSTFGPDVSTGSKQPFIQLREIRYSDSSYTNIIYDAYYPSGFKVVKDVNSTTGTSTINTGTHTTVYEMETVLTNEVVQVPRIYEGTLYAGGREVNLIQSEDEDTWDSWFNQEFEIQKFIAQQSAAGNLKYPVDGQLYDADEGGHHIIDGYDLGAVDYRTIRWIGWE